MKHFLPVCLIALVSVSVYAVPAKKGIRTFTQADGTTISLNVVGDENFHTYVTTDGLAVAKADDGNFYYRTSNGKSNVIAHNIGFRDAAELKFVAENQNDMDAPTIAKVARDAGAARKAPARAAKRASQVPTAGSPKVPIILVQYKDKQFINSNPKATFEEFFNTGNVSALKYFTDQSNGKYTPQFDIYGPVTLSNIRSYYGGNNSQGGDKRVGTMVGEACSSVDTQIDFSKYDNDGDGQCDVVIVMYAGDGEASSYDSDAANAVWPCQWDLYSSDYGKYLTLDNTIVNKFAVFNELNGGDLSKIDGIGTFCHEYSHCLDLPDFYDTNYGGHFGMGPWSIMDYGSYNNNGYTPLGYSAYEKEFMGWITIEEADENTKYNLPALNQGSIDTDKAIKITNSKDKNEYYILENRAQQGWDAYLPAEGMMITHVTYSSSAWTGNTVNNYDTQRMTIIPADNALKQDITRYNGTTYYSSNAASLKGDLWPYGNANELTDTSTPAAKVNTGSYMGKPVTEITKNSDGTVSFWFMKSPLESIATPVEVSHVVETSTSASLYWQPGDDTDVTYTVEVFKTSEVETQSQYTLINSADFSTETDWTGNIFYDSSSGEYFVGTYGRNSAILYSPAITTDADGVVTLKLNIKGYSSDTSVKVSLLDKYKMAYVTKTVPISTVYDTYSIVLNGTASSTNYIKVESAAINKYVFIKAADIYLGDASGADDESSIQSDSDKMTFTGITDTQLFLSGLEEYGTYYYRVKAEPVDDTAYAASSWSEVFQFTLSSTNGISDVTVDSDQAVYYTLQGIRVNGTPTKPGLYVRRQGNKSTKLLIK